MQMQEKNELMKKYIDVQKDQEVIKQDNQIKEEHNLVH